MTYSNEKKILNEPKGSIDINNSSNSGELTKASNKSWVIWGAAVAFYLYEYILRVSPSVMTDSLMLHFSVNATALGVLSSFYYYAYVPLQIPGGVIVDWLGARKVVTISALLCVVGTIIFATSESLFLAQIGRLLIGAGSACAFISCLKISAEWFPVSMFAMLAGVCQAMGTVGGTFGGRPFAMLVNAIGWQEALILAAAVGLGIMAAAWLLIRDKPTPPLSDKSSESPTLMEGLKVVVSNPQSWLIGAYGGLMYMPISAFAELWAVPFYKELYGIDNELASTISIMMFIGIAVGCPIGAWISDTIKSRTKVMAGSALLTMLMFMLVVYVPMSIGFMVVTLFITGVTCGGQIMYFPANKEINPSYVSGTTAGFTNCLVMVSGIIFQPLLGRVLDLAWNGDLKADGTPYYSVSDYQQALLSVPLCLLAAWLILLFVRDTYPKNANFKIKAGVK